ncbi:hypothetical protein EI067_30735 [Mycobacterium paragordonae]|uniref:hypothetical protein n=1 Tax=Mycobacterium paragordonae TaxID=1389713 RepID=UPI00105D7E5E|nr:hypothetical protein [Mycobacterium paragordonae]TDK85741.1 hypothetical protein EI067_30735 [Mycobacterium paragordonae]
MHDDDLSPAEMAERIVGDEADMVAHETEAALCYMLDTVSGFAEQVSDILTGLMPTLGQLQKLCEEINRYEGEHIEQWEDELFDHWREP